MFIYKYVHVAESCLQQLPVGNEVTLLIRGYLIELTANEERSWILDSLVISSAVEVAHDVSDSLARSVAMQPCCCHR